MEKSYLFPLPAPKSVWTGGPEFVSPLLKPRTSYSTNQLLNNASSRRIDLKTSNNMRLLHQFPLSASPRSPSEKRTPKGMQSSLAAPKFIKDMIVPVSFQNLKLIKKQRRSFLFENS